MLKEGGVYDEMATSTVSSPNIEGATSCKHPLWELIMTGVVRVFMSYASIRVQHLTRGKLVTVKVYVSSKLLRGE